MPSNMFFTSFSLDAFIFGIFCLVLMLRRFWLFVTPLTMARQALLSMGFSRQEYWSGLLCSPPGDLPNPGMDRMFCVSCVAGGFCTCWAVGEYFLSSYYLGKDTDKKQLVWWEYDSIDVWSRYCKRHRPGSLASRWGSRWCSEKAFWSKW